MIPTWVVVVASYLVIGLIVVGIGLVTMLRSRRRVELRNPRVLVRTLLLGAVAFVAWPVMVVLGVVWRFPGGRAWMIDYFGSGG